MTIIQERPQTAFACPSWCDGAPATHPDTEGEVIHNHAVGSLGVEVEESDRGPVVYFPELPIDDLLAPAHYARQLAADLIAAADVIEGAPRPAGAAVFEWPAPAWATETEYAPALDADAWHTRAIEDGDLLVYLDQSDKVEVSERRARIVRSAAHVTVDARRVGEPAAVLSVGDARVYARGSGVGAEMVAELLAAYDVAVTA